MRKTSRKSLYSSESKKNVKKKYTKNGIGIQFNEFMNSDIYKRAIFSERYFFPETILRPNSNFNRHKPPHYANTAGKTRKTNKRIKYPISRLFTPHK